MKKIKGGRIWMEPITKFVLIIEKGFISKWAHKIKKRAKNYTTWALWFQRKRKRFNSATLESSLREMLNELDVKIREED